MRSAVRYLIPALVLAALVPAVAGESGKKKCTMNTQDCLDAMSVQMKSSGWVGVEYDTDNPGGLKVINVMPGSPAAKAGIQTGDILWELEGVRMTTDNGPAIQKARKSWVPGQKVTYTIQRNAQNRQVTLTLASWPADVVAKSIGQHMLEHVSTEMATTRTN